MCFCLSFPDGEVHAKRERRASMQRQQQRTSRQQLDKQSQLERTRFSGWFGFGAAQPNTQITFRFGPINRHVQQDRRTAEHSSRSMCLASNVLTGQSGKRKQHKYGNIQINIGHNWANISICAGQWINVLNFNRISN